MSFPSDVDHRGPGSVPNPAPGGRSPKSISGLVNARLMAFEYPDTFFLPKDSDIRKLRTGDFVKLSRNNERFWVQITGYVGRKWHGTVANKLANNQDIGYGDKIYFMKKNIYDTVKIKK